MSIPSSAANLGAKQPSATPSASTGKCIVVFGTKGGVGKTVVAVNIAVGLVQRSKKSTCLVDLDVMALGDVSKALNISPRTSILDLIPLFKQPPSATAAQQPSQSQAVDTLGVHLNGTLVSHSSGIHVLAGPTNPRQLSQLDPQALPRIFEALKQRFDYVIIDGGRAFSEPLIAAFDAADLILLVVTPDVLTLYQTKWAIGVVESLLFPSMMVKAVLNRAESRGGVGRQDVRSAIPIEVIGEIPSDGNVVGTAMNQGVPVVTGFTQTKVAAGFLSLAETLATRSDLYIPRHDIPRHRSSEDTAPSLTQDTSWSARLYAGEATAQQQEVVDEIVLMKRRIHDQLVEELDLKKLDLATMANNQQIVELRERTKRIITNLLAKQMGGLISSHEVRERLVKEITDEALGYGPLEDLLSDETVTDILVNNKDQIYVERKGKLELTAKKFVSNDQVRAIIERIIAPLGRRIDESTPMVDARLPDGSRVNAVIQPLSVKGPALSIRKFARVRYTHEDLIKFGSVSAPMVEFIRGCVYAKKNMIISGGTGSGKTTFLGIVSAFIPEGERIVTIEDAAELRLSQTHWVSLESRPASVEGKGAITIRDLFRNTLRMRPDRIIIGECRGGESLDMLQAMNTGHDGSITTIHANSPKDVIGRLDSMVLMSNIDLPVRAIREMVASAIDVIIHTARLSDGSRKITAITELTSINDQMEIQLQHIFVFQQSGLAPDGTVLGEFVATGNLPTFLRELTVKGVGLDESLFKKPDGAAAA